MRKITFTVFALFIGLFMFAQSANTTLDFGPKGPQTNSSKGAWTVQFNYIMDAVPGSAGCETDGTNYYVAQWSSNLIWKFNMLGVKVDSFSIAGVSGLRDLAYDGQYFYGGASTNTIYKMDFTSTPPSLVGTINSPSETVRNICYDPTANSGAGGFWVGNWATNFSLVSRTGTVLSTITAANHGLSSTYGTAFDTISAGGPYIWTISAGTPANTSIIQINVATGLQTGVVHDITTDIATLGDIGGGLWIEPGIVTGTVTLGGLVQGTSIFGYDLSTTAPLAVDLQMNSINIPALSPIGQNTNIMGVISNQGTTTITSYKLNYQVDAGPVVTQNVIGANIASYQTVTFTHSTPYSATSGLHNIAVWVSDPNTQVDDYTGNDTLIGVTNGYDPSAAVQRMPLYETFTSSTCAPCVAGNTNMQALFAANPNKWVAVKYQMSWPGDGDPYYTAEGNTRRNFYGVNSVPWQFIDGGYGGNSQSVVQADFNTAYANPAFMGITAALVSGGNIVTVNYTIDPKMAFPASSQLYIAIVEKKTVMNVGTNGETEFHWVMKKMLPNGAGTPIGPLTANTPVTNTVQYTFNGSYRLPNNAGDPINHAIEHSVEEFSDLLAVVWVQSSTTGEVYQSALSTFTIGMDEQTRDKIIRNIYPNPANSKINVDLEIPNNENVEVTIYNNLGQLMMTETLGSVSGSQNLTFDISKLSQGIYFVNVQIGDKKFVKPIQVN